MKQNRLIMLLSAIIAILGGIVIYMLLPMSSFDHETNFQTTGGVTITGEDLTGDLSETGINTFTGNSGEVDLNTNMFFELETKSVSDGLQISGNLSKYDNVSEIKKISVTSCDNNLSTGYEKKEYFLKKFKLPNFSYNISVKNNNVCEIPYKIAVYNASGIIFETEYKLDSEDFDKVAKDVFYTCDTSKMKKGKLACSNGYVLSYRNETKDGKVDLYDNGNIIFKGMNKEQYCGGDNCSIKFNYYPNKNYIAWDGEYGDACSDEFIYNIYDTKKLKNIITINDTTRSNFSIETESEKIENTIEGQIVSLESGSFLEHKGMIINYFKKSGNNRKQPKKYDIYKLNDIQSFKVSDECGESDYKISISYDHPSDSIIIKDNFRKILYKADNLAKPVSVTKVK